MSLVRHLTHADLGGQAGHGPIDLPDQDQLFHADWERRVLAVTLAMGATGQWNIDTSRASRETLPQYLRLSYYEIWFQALLKLLAERGLVSTEEAASGHATLPPKPLARVLAAADVQAVLRRGAPTERPAPQPARFAIGQRVRTHATMPPQHTRLPGYARGKTGVIEQLRGTHVFADSHARGLGEDPQWLYTVAFSGAELWGETSPGLTVSIDAWEPYLESAETDDR